MDKIELQVMLAKEMRQYMVNANFNVADVTQALNESKQTQPISEEQAKSLRYLASKHVRDFRRFTMNSAYNFY